MSAVEPERSSVVTFEDVAQKVDDMHETLHFLVDGMKLQAAALGHHGEMLAAILTAVSDRDEPADSPLIALLTQLVAESANHARALDRIEAAIKGMAPSTP
jgi:hypothetical protein